MNHPPSRLLVILILALTAGCLPPIAPPPQSLKEAEKKLVDICRKEYNLEVLLFPRGNTLWVYAPSDIDFFELKVSENGPQEAVPPSEARTIYFLDSKYSLGRFHIRYDIGKGKKSGDSPGYGYQYSQKFQDVQRYLLTAVSRAFADVEKREDQPGLYQKVEGDVDYVGADKNASHKKLVHSYIKTERVPDFFVIIVADIKNGLAAKMVFYLDDILRGMSDQFFREEYSRRVLNEGAVGSTAIIGDKEGRHLQLKSLTWADFLAKQISHRIRFKYSQSDFPPGEDSDKEILKIIAQTFSSYSFDNFFTIELTNTAEEKTLSIDKEKLATYLENP